MAVKQFSHSSYTLQEANDMVKNYIKLFTKRIFFMNKYLQDMVSGYVNKSSSL
jgi:hypothetical protein